MSVLVLRMAGQEYQAKYLYTGDVGPGHHGLPNLSFGPLAVDANTEITVNYQIDNVGQANYEELEAKLLKAGADLAEVYAKSKGWGNQVSPNKLDPNNSGNDWHGPAQSVIDFLKEFFKGCDGLVALDQFTYTGADVRSATANKDACLFQTLSYPGIDSTPGCGSNSLYTVTWQLIRVLQVPLP